MRTLIVNSKASGDINAAIVFYEQVSQHLADQFIRELQSAFKLLLDHPEIGSLRFASIIPGEQLRAWKLQRFPYLVLYLANPASLSIRRVIHERRTIGPGTLGESGR